MLQWSRLTTLKIRRFRYTCHVWHRVLASSHLDFIGTEPSDILLDVPLSGSTTYWPKEQTSPWKWVHVSSNEREPTQVAEEPDLSPSEQKLRVMRRLMLGVPRKIIVISRLQLQCQESYSLRQRVQVRQRLMFVCCRSGRAFPKGESDVMNAEL